MAHTEGAERWRAIPTEESDKGGNHRIVDGKGSELATVWARTDGETAKPAKLIAASPTLLAAAKAELNAGEGICYAGCEAGRPCATCQLRIAIEEAS